MRISDWSSDVCSSDLIGTGLTAPAGAVRVDGSGKWVTPGLIDIHSHLGVYPSPGARAHSDGNEATAPVTANVWAEHSVWPQDEGFLAALAGGITSLQVLPGSDNPERKTVAEGKRGCIRG